MLMSKKNRKVRKYRIVALGSSLKFSDLFDEKDTLENLITGITGKFNELADEYKKQSEDDDTIILIAILDKTLYDPHNLHLNDIAETCTKIGIGHHNNMELREGDKFLMAYGNHGGIITKMDMDPK